MSGFIKSLGQNAGGLLGAAAGFALGGPGGAAAGYALGAGTVDNPHKQRKQERQLAGLLQAPSPIAQDNALAQKAALDERNRQKRAMGRASTVLTQGMQSNPQVEIKSLIGGG